MQTSRYPAPWDALLTTERLYMPSSTRTNPDERSEFERDYDRLIFAPPFRRLQDKAQVFPLEHNDFVRTRLTHSLEVSTLGRSLGRQAAARINRLRGLNLPGDDLGTIVATTCLAHDIGNPPFGHAGEEAIQRWFRRHFETNPGLQSQLNEAQQQDFLRFDGNAQGLRILCFLQSLGYDNGLNLTGATLAAFMKYVVPSNGVQKGSKSRKKPGFFQSEAAKVAQLRARVGLVQGRHPLVFLMEAADDIAYSVVDIEDAFKKRVLREEVFVEKLERGLLGSSFAWLVDKFKQRLMRDGQRSYHERLGSAVQWLRIDAIGLMFQSVVEAFEQHYDEILGTRFDQELMEVASARPVWEALKRIGVEEVYGAREIVELEVFGDRVIRDLLDHFVSACLSEQRNNLRTLEGKIFSFISPSMRALQQEYTQMSAYDCMQLAVDHVCGMTDTYAVMMYQKLRGGGLTL